MQVTQAIIPAAGLGTRFLPFTKSVPKELLPILNTPALQYILQEGIDSGITHFGLITHKTKQVLVHHFEPANPFLENALKDSSKKHLLDQLEYIIQSTQLVYIDQPKPLGLGHAIGLAQTFATNPYIGIMLPDEIIISKQPALAQLITIAKQYNASVIGVQEVPPHAVSSYGIIRVSKKVGTNLHQIAQVVEKPSIENAPSNLAIIGRYVLSQDIFDALDVITKRHTKGEIQLTDALEHMIAHNKPVLAYTITGSRFDIGSPRGWLQANLYSALQDSNYANDLKKFIENTLNI